MTEREQRLVRDGWVNVATITRTPHNAYLVRVTLGLDDEHTATGSKGAARAYIRGRVGVIPRYARRPGPEWAAYVKSIRAHPRLDGTKEDTSGQDI